MVRCVGKLIPARTTAYLTSEVERLKGKLADPMEAELKQYLKVELADKRAKLQQS